MDVELLITEIKKCPLLWDVWHEQYKDKQKKTEGWLRIASTIVKDYATKSEVEKKMIVQEIVSKWRTVRDNYVRNVKKQIQNGKSGVSAKKIPRYLYEDQLSFLKKNTEQRLVSNNTKEDQNDEETENSDAISVEVATSVTETRNDVIPNNARRRKIKNFTSPSAKRLKRGSVGQKLVALLDSRANSASTSDADDEDLTFYKSTLSLVKTLNIDQKLQFRIQVMQILQAIKQADVTPCNSASPTPGSSTYGTQHHYYNVYPENPQPRVLYATPPPASPQSASSNSQHSVNSPPAEGQITRRSKCGTRIKIDSPLPGDC